MGPRSCERGNRHWLRPATLAAHRFNGAALVRARKSVTGTAAPPVLDPSFNGAALVRARKSPGEQIPRARLTALQWGRARASAEMPSFGFSLSHHPMLQWGRARASAEIAVHRAINKRFSVASMGPRSCERGNPVSTDPDDLSELLQWGRARASAEIRCGFPSRHAHFNGFNGAALVRARKWPGCKQLGLRRRNNRFRAAAIFNLLTNWACRFLFILLCVLRPCLQRCERLAVVRCHVAARTLAHG